MRVADTNHVDRLTDANIFVEALYRGESIELFFAMVGVGDFKEARVLRLGSNAQTTHR